MIAQNIGTVAVLGASGRLGRLVVQSLLANGLRVKALVHRHPLELNDSGLVAVPGSVHDLESIRLVLEGSDAVASTLGSADAKIADVCTMASRHLVKVMREFHLTRIVATTGSAARLDFEIGSEHPYLISRRNSLMPFMSGLILDGEAQMRTLSDSDLAWTVIRLPRMLFDDRRSILLRSAPAASGETVGYAQAASAIVDELVRPQWIAQAPFAVPS
jgi:putative NADH-flavin reductase